MTLKKSDMQSNQGRYTKRQLLTLNAPEYPDCSDQTAWILGAGSSLIDIWDWQVPKNTKVITMNSSILWAWEHYKDNQPDKVIMKGTELHSPDDYRRPVDYWFARDNAVFTPHKEPEKWYSQIAMRHPTMTKIVEQHNPVNEDMPNLHLVICERDWQRVLTLNIPHNNRLMGGPTVLLTALSFVYRCKFKRVILSGVDFCLVKRGGNLHGQGQEIRRFMDLKNIRKNHELSDRRCSRENETKDTSGATVYQCGMMRNHMNAGMSMIRKMQGEGIFFCKTSKTGMAYMPYIETEKQLALIASGAKIKYNE